MNSSNDRNDRSFYTTDRYEIIKFFLIRLELMLNKTKFNGTIKQLYHKQTLVKKDWISYRRFRILHSQCMCDMNKLTEMLRASFSSTISPGSLVAVDELLVGFSSRKDNRIISIKRKPHNRGYLIYI